MSSIDKYLKTTSTSQEIYKRSLKSIPGGNTRGVVFYAPYPAYATMGKGSHIWDVDGNERIDYMLNASVLVLGHSNPKVISAIRDQLENGIILGTPTELEVKLAEKIIEMVPCVDKVRFSVTGTEACMNVIRVARAYTGKKKIVLMDGYYHGTTDDFFKPVSEGITEEATKNILITPFNDCENLEKMIKDQKDEIAAVMIEPVLGSGGGIVATKEFLTMCREITSENDIVLIFDEIQTGFRLGKGGAQERFGVLPDLVSLGKGLMGGLPGSAYGGREDILDFVGVFPKTANPLLSKPRVPTGGTHNAHPLSMASGLAHLGELKKSVFEHIDNVGRCIRDNIEKISKDLGIQVQTTGIGSFFSVYFSNKALRCYQDTKYADPRLRWYFDISLLNKGVYLAPHHVSYTCAATSDNDLRVTLEAMEESLTEMKPLIKEISPNLFY